MTVSPLRTRPTQQERVLRYLRAHPGASHHELNLAFDPPIVNITARISDLVAAGHVIDLRTRPDGQRGWFLVEEPVQLTMEVA